MKKGNKKSHAIIKVPKGTKRVLLEGDNKLIGVTVRRGKKVINIFYSELL